MPEDIAAVLAKAWKAVKDAEIPDHLQELAFGRAIDLLADNYARPRDSAALRDNVDTSGQQQNPGGSANKGGDGGGPVDEAELYRRMSEGTGVPAETLERLVHLDGGVPKILLKKAQLSKKNGTSQKAITLLLSVATHYLTGDDEVDLGPIRDEVKDLNFLDGNYTKNIGGIADILVVGTKGGNKKVKIRKAFLQSFRDELSKYELLKE